ncbi:MAG: DUF547 domain-containing protein [Maribacter sp.]
MFKLALFLFGSFWLSCGNAAQSNQIKTTSKEEILDTIQTVSIDTTLSNTSENSTISTPENNDETSENSEVLKKEEPTSKPVKVAQEKPKATIKTNTVPSHSQWNSLLSKYVNDKGDVNYKAFQNDSAALNEYLNFLAENSPVKGWSKNEKLAYYINLYNAATVKLILDNYPTNSIKDIKNPWGKDWVKTGDGLISLGDIEHKILREMNEPRIHFAINCASYSCPKLLNKAFTASKMEAQLQSVTLDFINDKSRNIISKEKLQLSNIFKWYKKDFTENGSLADYIKPYTAIEIDADTNIDYLKYDWNLNEAK